MNIVKKSAAVALLGLAAQAFAQESRTETQAIRCSAAYFVLTAVTEVNPPLGEYFTQMVQQMGTVYAEERQRRSIRVVNRDVSSRREVILKEFVATYKQNPKAVQQEALFCMSWTEAVRVKGAPFDYTAVWPNEILPKVKTAWSEMVPTVFDAWIESGALTPGDARQEIERSLRQKQQR